MAEHFTFSSFLLAGKEMHILKTLASLKVNGEGCVSFNIPDTLLRVLTLLILRVNAQAMKSF